MRKYLITNLDNILKDIESSFKCDSIRLSKLNNHFYIINWNLKAKINALSPRLLAFSYQK